MITRNRQSLLLLLLEREMLEIVFTFISCGMVGAFILYHIKTDRLPPKAQLVCDMWEIVEKNR